jgi:hypothetical protein
MAGSYTPSVEWEAFEVFGEPRTLRTPRTHFGAHPVLQITPLVVAAAIETIVAQT